MSDGIPDDPRLRVLFIHGKESSPHGTKARQLAETFDAHCEAMDTDDFEGSVALQSRAVDSHRPHVVVGSSYGGAVLCELLRRGLWRGPSLMLAQAAVLYDSDIALPEDIPVVLVHGRQDDIVPPDHSRILAATGSPCWTVLHEVDDDHSLSETVRSGRLLDYVREAALMGEMQR